MFKTKFVFIVFALLFSNSQVYGVGLTNVLGQFFDKHFICENEQDNLKQKFILSVVANYKDKSEIQKLCEELSNSCALKLNDKHINEINLIKTNCTYSPPEKKVVESSQFENSASVKCSVKKNQEQAIQITQTVNDKTFKYVVCKIEADCNKMKTPPIIVDEKKFEEKENYIFMCKPKLINNLYNCDSKEVNLDNCELIAYDDNSWSSKFSSEYTFTHRGNYINSTTPNDPKGTNKALPPTYPDKAQSGSGATNK